MTISIIYPVFHHSQQLLRQNLPLNSLTRNLLDKHIPGRWMVEYSIIYVDCRLVSTVRIGRYFCPNQGDSSYPVWEPRAVSQGACRSKPWDDMIGAPLPPNAKILLYGNSHLRQVIQYHMPSLRAHGRAAAETVMRDG